MDNRIVIEVLGIGLPNRGAELMLAVVHQEVEQRLHGRQIEWVMSPDVGYLYRSQYPFFTRASLMVGQIDFLALLGRFLPKRFRVKIKERYGLVFDQDIDVLLDCSGFAYGDFWGAEKLNRRILSRFKREPSPLLIFLPQAFGPFMGAKFRRGIHKALSISALCYARDEVSHQHLINTSPLAAKVTIVKDFSCLYRPPIIIPDPKLVLVVPNYMLIRNQSFTNEEYIDLLSSVVETTRVAGFRCELLVHDPHQDLALANSISQQVTPNLEIHNPESLAGLKQLISSAHLVVGSRYHAIISALNQNVPAIGLGWSHKYEELFCGYGQPKWCATKSTVIPSLLELLDPNANHMARGALQHKNSVMLIESRELFDNVANKIMEKFGNDHND